MTASKYEAWESPYPHRVDLKLPINPELLEERKEAINEWLRFYKPKALGGQYVPLEMRGFTHLTMWFDRQDLATLFKLTWNGV